MVIDPKKRTVHLDAQGLLAWLEARHFKYSMDKAKLFVEASRHEFDRGTNAMTGRPTKEYLEQFEFTAQIWDCDHNFGLNIPLRFVTFDDEVA